MKHLIYLIGVPGSGKSTLTKELFREVPFEIKNIPVPHLLYANGAQIGAIREKFSGTDALGMAIQPKVVEWLKGDCPERLYAEGDRLANDKFFTEVTSMGIKLTVFHLKCPEALAIDRRKQRQSNQDPTWLKGRTTKVASLVEKWVLPQNNLDARLTPAELSVRLKIHPIILVLTTIERPKQ